MRSLSTLFIAMAFTPIAASAHTLAGDVSLVDALGHQVASGHHLPLLLAAIAAVLVIRRVLRETRR